MSIENLCYFYFRSGLGIKICLNDATYRQSFMPKSDSVEVAEGITLSIWATPGHYRTWHKILP